MAITGWRRSRRLALAAALWVAGSGGALAACGGSGGEQPADAATTRPPATTATTAGTTTTTAATTTTTTAVALPVPEPMPADDRAPTPQVVHGTLSLPTIGVEQELQEGVTLTAIDRGPSHWPGTAMPGQVGNVVVAGHRVTNTRPFYDLDLLRPGDPLIFRMSDGSTYTYELTSTEIVDDSAMHIVSQTPERTATLFACHPKHSAAQRIVGHFRLVDSVQPAGPSGPAGPADAADS